MNQVRVGIAVFVFKNVRFGAITNDQFPSENKHYVTIWMLSDWAAGQERITEPEKCEAQAWHTFEDLRALRFSPWEQLFASDFIIQIQQQMHVQAKPSF